MLATLGAQPGWAAQDGVFGGAPEGALQGVHFFITTLLQEPLWVYVCGDGKGLRAGGRGPDHQFPGGRQVEEPLPPMTIRLGFGVSTTAWIG